MFGLAGSWHTGLGCCQGEVLGRAPTATSADFPVTIPGVWFFLSRRLLFVLDFLVLDAPVWTVVEGMS